MYCQSVRFDCAAFPVSRSAPRLDSWYLSWTYRSACISSYQILMSIVGDLERHNEVDSQSGCIYTVRVQSQLKSWVSMIEIVKDIWTTIVSCHNRAYRFEVNASECICACHIVSNREPRSGKSCPNASE